MRVEKTPIFLSFNRKNNFPSGNKINFCTKYKQKIFFIYFPIGLLSWDAVQTHVDLEEELNTITVHAPEGEDARHGKSKKTIFSIIVKQFVKSCSEARSKSLMSIN